MLELCFLNFVILKYKVDKTLSPKTEMRDLYGNVMTNPSQVYVGTFKKYPIKNLFLAKYSNHI